MSQVNLIGKRKKSRQKQPNPLFLQWLQEWRDDAASKGNKSQFTYSKAYTSLKKYPLRLESGKDCKLLEGFGDKICSMLDKKLDEYIAVNGSAGISVAESQNDTPAHVPHSVGSRGIHCFSADSGSDDEGNAVKPSNEAKRRPQAARDQRDYIPAFRSGPYAILLALFQETQVRGASHLSKKDLMRLAQPLADKSFTIPDPGSRYTAWSSMGSLIKKGLVTKEHSPAKYCLTDSGKILAQRLLAADHTRVGECCGESETLHFTIGGGREGRASPPREDVLPDLPSIQLNQRNDRMEKPEACSPAIKRKKTMIEKIELSDSDSDDMQVPSLMNRLNSKIVKVDQEEQGGNHTSESAASHTSRFDHCDTRLKFSYVSDDNQTVTQKDKAAVLIADDFGVGFLVRATYEDLLLSGIKYQLDTSRYHFILYGLVYIDQLVDYCVLKLYFSDINRPSVEGYLYAYLHNDDAPEESNPVIQCFLQEESVNVKKKEGTTVKKKEFKAAANSQSAVDTSSQLSFPSISIRVLPAGLDSQASIPSSTESSQSSVGSDVWLESLPSPEFSLWPGTFDVILLVDNQEVYGAGSSKNTLITELRKNKVPMEVRNLQVGDFLWIARPKIGSDTKSKELVLDYIIERKRMDDLASSIIDGRFREQKFRLKNCGLKNPIYLVEDYGSVQHFSIDKDALSQAVINTQIIDGFYIKRTGDIKESVAYLTMMTRYLQSFYTNKTLHACSKRDKDNQPGKVSFTDKDIRLVTFVEFDRLSVKTRKLTVQEMFGKQLVQIQGITVEKAAAIVEKYPTVTRLMEGYSQCASVKEKENLMCFIKFGAMSRSIGQILSKQIYWLYHRDPLQ